MTARARRTDPSTSRAAAKSVTALEEKRLAIMMVLRALGHAVSDEVLVKEYNLHRAAFRLPVQSDSGIRSRRAELVADGRVVHAGYSRTRSGRRTKTWELARIGQEESPAGQTGLS